MLLNCISLLWHVDVSFASLGIQALFVPSLCLLFLIMEWRKRGSLRSVDGGNPRKGIRLYRPGVLLQLLTSCPLSVLQLSLHAAWQIIHRRRLKQSAANCEQRHRVCLMNFLWLEVHPKYGKIYILSHLLWIFVFYLSRQVFLHTSWCSHHWKMTRKKILNSTTF